MRKIGKSSAGRGDERGLVEKEGRLSVSEEDRKKQRGTRRRAGSGGERGQALGQWGRSEKAARDEATSGVWWRKRARRESL